uniref:Putative basic tail protein n=1 Tax=Rhipicephalus pulchellus TaxID=72859 RepID=L7LTG9_RHIPC
MSILYLLIALVPVVPDEAAGEAVCPNKTWNPETDHMWTRCVHFCADSDGKWHMGFFDNGTWCHYDNQTNGTCYEGYCHNVPYKDANIPRTTESNTVDKKKKSKSSVFSTEPTATIDSPTEKPEDKTKKKGKENKKDEEKGKDHRNKENEKDKVKESEKRKEKEKGKKKVTVKKTGKKTEETVPKEAGPVNNEW